MKIAFQGERGAYSELAIYKHFGKKATPIGFDNFDDIFDSVASEKVDFGFIPVENTIAGTVVENYDLLLTENVLVVAEVFLPISHTLLGTSDATLDAIKKAYSHPHALKQCKNFLKKRGIIPCPTYDTAGAAKKVSKEKKNDCSAIASELCAKLYGMKILKKGIQTTKTNITRFFAIVKKGKEADNINYEKTTIAFKTKHRPGALVDCLKVFQEHNLNLTKLESRPVPENPWEYVFYTGFEGGINADNVKSALEGLLEHALLVRVLGSYPKG